MENILPVLNNVGWVTEPDIKIDYLLSHVFTSDYAQSILYRDNITSLSKIFQESGSNIDSLTYKLKTSLEKYLSNYFDSVEVTVDEAVKDNPSSKVELFLNIVINNGYNKYGFVRLLKADKGKFENIIKIING